LAQSQPNDKRWSTDARSAEHIGFRAGIEGRINSRRRDYGRRRWAYHGMAGLQRWLGWAILASNVCQIAQAKVSHSLKKQAV
jgi:transposase, IS5 family